MMELQEGEVQLVKEGVEGRRIPGGGGGTGGVTSLRSCRKVRCSW